MTIFSCAVSAHLNGFQLELDLELEDCKFTVVWGPSGSGKTTLLRVLAGLEKNVKGSLSFRGDQWQSGPQFLPAYERPVGYVFQSSSLLPHLSVRQNLAYALKRSNSTRSIEDVSERFHMTHLLDKSVDQLSGGETQRVSLARTVLTDPKVVLMDEPIASVDAKGRLEILNEIRDFSNYGIPVIYVTHSIEELLLLADRVLILNEGKKSFYGGLPDALNYIFERHPEGVTPVSVLGMIAEEYDDHYSLQTVRSGEDSIFFTCANSMASGTSVRVIVYGKDVVLFKNRPEGASALNILRATILSAKQHDLGQVFITLNTTAGDLRTLVTKKSYDHLQLSVGDSVWAVTKAVSILV